MSEAAITPYMDVQNWITFMGANHALAVQQELSGQWFWVIYACDDGQWIEEAGVTWVDRSEAASAGRERLCRIVGVQADGYTPNAPSLFAKLAVYDAINAPRSKVAQQEYNSLFIGLRLKSPLRSKRGVAPEGFDTLALFAHAAEPALL